MELPLVSVICLCYNHEGFVQEAIESVLHQTYPNIQVIVVDDFSTDKSEIKIQKIIAQNSRSIEFLPLKKNLGNCKAFNSGLKLAKGAYVIDFATDDVMMPDRIEKQVDFFQQQNEQVGVVFTDSIYISENGSPIRDHYEYLFKNKIVDHIPNGDVFRDVLRTYFISGPTMIVRKNVMDKLHGYDEELAYEDFDFWIRASREFHFAFLNDKTTKVRILTGSMSANQYRKGDKQLHSTFLVCLKAEKLCRDARDRDALRWRALYEYKHAVFSDNKTESKLFAELLKRLGEGSFLFLMVRLASSIPISWAWIRIMYHKLRFG